MINRRVRCLAFLCAFVLCFVSAFPIFAWTELGPFSYWYSDSYKIGYLSGSTNYVRVQSTGAGFSYSTLLSFACSAMSAWSSEGPFTLSNSSYKIIIKDVTRDYASSIQIPNDADAFTKVKSKTYVGPASVIGGGGTKSVYIMNQVEICLIYDDVTVQYSNSKLSSIIAHEFGHAVGYFGHDTGATALSKSLMSPFIGYFWDSWHLSGPQTRDLQHMGNV